MAFFFSAGGAIFERFYRARQKGASPVDGHGLGLSIVRQLVTLHSGTITVDGKEFESGSNWDDEKPTTLGLGSGKFVPGFEESLVGLIPNCAVSVLLTQLYLAGTVSFGALLAGLCSGAGLGVAVLVKMNRSRRENGQIILTLYLIAALCGLAVQLLF